MESTTETDSQAVDHLHHAMCGCDAMGGEACITEAGFFVEEALLGDGPPILERWERHADFYVLVDPEWEGTPELILICDEDPGPEEPPILELWDVRANIPYTPRNPRDLPQ